MTVPQLVDHSFASDAALVSKAQTGDQFAFNELCRRHSSKVMRHIRRIVHDLSDAEDALQDALLSAFTHLHSFQSRASFSTWLTRIAINAALSKLRRARHTTVPIEYSEDDSRTGEVYVIQDESPGPEQQLIQKQKEMHLTAAIHRLPPRLRSVVELRVREGYSGKQIARRIGISESAVKSRLLRAHLRLVNHDGVHTSGYVKVKGSRATRRSGGRSRAH